MSLNNISLINLNSQFNPFYNSINIDSSGNVGIGKTNPLEILDISGNIKFLGDIIGSGNKLFSLNATNITSGVLSVNRGGTGATTLTAGRILIGNGTSTLLQSANLTWDNTNNRLGIGITNPTYMLDVTGDINITGSFRVNGTAFSSQWTTTGSNIYYNTGSIYIGSITNSSDDNNTTIVFPDSTLYVRGSRTAAATTHITFRGGLEGSNNGKVRLWLASDASHASYIENEHTSSGNTVLMFGTSSGNALPVERMRIGSDGTITTNNNNINAGTGTITAATFSGNATTATNASGLTGTPNITVGTITCSSITGTGQTNQITNTTNGGVRLNIRNNSSGVNAFTGLEILNATGTPLAMFLNSSARTTDGGVNTATLRNDAGDLRLSAASNSPFIYLKSSNGNIGIGTTNPTASLDIIKTNAVASVTDLLNMRFDDNWGLEIQQSYTAVGNIQYNFIHRYNAVDYNSLTFKGANVGIGKTNPGTSLDVVGTVTSTLFSGSGASLTALNASNITSGILNAIYGGTGCTSLNALHFDTSGNVLSLKSGAGGGSNQWTTLNNNIYFNTANVGIGITNPNYKLHVDDGIVFIGDTMFLNNSSSNIANNYYLLFDNTYNGTEGNGIAANKIRLMNDTSNNILAGFGIENNSITYHSGSSGSHTFYSGTSNSNYGTGRFKIDQSGNITCTGDFAAFTSISDKRLKTNINKLNSSIDIIKKLNPVKFCWKYNNFILENKQGTEDVGFIAQEIEEVIPLAVGEYKVINSKETYKNIKYERIIPYLVKSIQELIDKVEKLEHEIIHLKCNIQS